MKKLPLIIAALFAADVCADVTISATPMKLYKNGVEVTDVTRSTSREKLMEKASSQGNGVYKGYSEITITVTGQGTTPTPTPTPTPAPAPAPTPAPAPDPAPAPVCEPPRQWLPSDEQGEPDYCGCEAGENYIEETNKCEPLDMGHNHEGLPVVDTSKNIQPAVGQSVVNIAPAIIGYSPDNKAGTNEGDFRLNCNVSHMANDDPIVYPNQQGAAHHHTFFGNTAAYYDADVSKMETFGNSTCHGGIANRSAYWVPSMIDTSTNTPLNPDGIGVYYKTQRASDVTVPPKGLRIIAKGFTETDFMCNEDYGGRGINQIIPCGQGGQLRYGVNFPNCWDGVNLDSPDHMSHMAYVVWSDACPATHPVRIPNITINAFYNVDTPAGTANWRLSSDPDGAVAGSSNHADWVNGWDTDTITAIVNNCLKNEQDCHSDLIGDGRQMY